MQCSLVGGHGVSVAGCAAATTDNAIGVSAPAFKGKFLPVRVGSGTSIPFGFEGIVYAAEHGCQYINCSWGGNFPSLFEEDIIQYVSVNLERLVIAGAGNNWNDVKFYPAAYPHVLAVAATENTDEKAGFSCYGEWIDVCAPGASVYSTSYGNSYSFLDGTSFASPITAGAASLVNATFPTLSPVQVGALLKATCTNINSVNPSFIGLLGSGRINLYQAVQSAYPSPSLEMESFNLTDYKGDVFSPNDTADLTLTYINYLAPTGNTVVSLSTSSPYLSFLNNNVNFGIIGTLALVDNNANPISN
jgi:serine protease